MTADTTTTVTNTVTNTVTGTATEKVKKAKKKTDTILETESSDTSATTLTLDQAVAQLNVTNPSWDLFLIGFFVVGALLYGLSLGKDRIISIMVSIYMALAVVAALPEFVLNIKINESYTFQITAFLAVFIVLFFLLSRQAVLNALSPSDQGKWWQVLLFSILHVGLLISVTMSFLPPSLLGRFSPLTQYLFTDQWTNFGWIIAPIVAMILVGRNQG